MASRLLLPTIVTAILLVQARGVGGQVPSANASPNAATCSLKLRGRNAVGDAPKHDQDSELTDQGVQGVQLTCSTDPPGQQVPITVNRTWISSQHTSGFEVSRIAGSNLCGTCYRTHHIHKATVHVCPKIDLLNRGGDTFFAAGVLVHGSTLNFFWPITA